MFVIFMKIVYFKEFL